MLFVPCDRMYTKDTYTIQQKTAEGIGTGHAVGALQNAVHVRMEG